MSAVKTASPNQSSGWLFGLITLVMVDAAAFYFWPEALSLKLAPRIPVGRHLARRHAQFRTPHVPGIDRYDTRPLFEAMIFAPTFDDPFLHTHD